MAAWEAAEPRARALDFVPRAYPNLRSVPRYPDAVRERFERCLDLYLCPRSTRRRAAADPDALLPKLPDAASLRPFPSACAEEYRLPGDTVPRFRTVSVDPSGCFVAAGADDGRVGVWEVGTARLLGVWDLGGPVPCVAWCPLRARAVVAAVVGKNLVFLYPGTATQSNAETTWAALAGTRKEALAAAPASEEEEGEGEGAPAPSSCTWKHTAPASADALLSSSAGPATTGVMVVVSHPHLLTRLAWHSKGDYVVTVASGSTSNSLFTHQLSRGVSTCPFPNGTAALGLLQAAVFHPTAPLLLIANQRSVRTFHLTNGTWVGTKLESGALWISSLDVHPSGNHVLVAAHDGRVVWFDTELSSTPYRTLRYGDNAVRAASFHPRFPLMASAAEDGCVHVFHARVYDDFNTNPLIVPLRVLRAHTVVKDLGVQGAAWHPVEPWLFTAGADGAVRLWQSE